MKEYTIITYRLRRSTQPADVLGTIEELLPKHGAGFQTCLFDMKVSIIEMECEGVFHSNRKRNGLLRICKNHPVFEAFFEHSKEDRGGYVFEDISVCNFSRADYSPKGTVEYATIREVVPKIPRPYSVNSLELIWDDIRFSSEKEEDRIRPAQKRLGPPVGNYIYYNRSVYGDEKHAYILFSADSANVDAMRALFFEFAERIPGKYEGTEIQIG